MIPRLDHLVAAVQRNCHIADARHARDMTLCTYLLEMREFYRWEAGIAPGEPLARSEVGEWLSAREALWETLADDDFAPLPLAGAAYAPFDVAAINAVLLPHHLVYGAGIGRFGKPHFFLGRLDRHERYDGLTVLVCACEYARDLGAPPAVLQGDTAIVRREALTQWLWEKAEAWAMKKIPGAMALALAAHGYADDPRAALTRLTEAETETLILHERGEHVAGRLLGPSWEARLACTSKRRAEILMRAVRDNLADCLVTLPTLIERQAWSSLWFWFANLDGMRRELFPALAAFEIEKVGAVTVGGTWRGRTDFGEDSRERSERYVGTKVGAGGTAHAGSAASMGTAADGLKKLAERGATHFERLARRLLDRDEAVVEALSHDIPALALA